MEGNLAVSYRYSTTTVPGVDTSTVIIGRYRLNI